MEIFLCVLFVNSKNVHLVYIYSFYLVTFYVVAGSSLVYQHVCVCMFFKPCNLRDWELHVNFKIHGSGQELYGDGIAIWYTKHRMELGDS